METNIKQKRNGINFKRGGCMAEHLALLAFPSGGCLTRPPPNTAASHHTTCAHGVGEGGWICGFLSASYGENDGGHESCYCLLRGPDGLSGGPVMSPPLLFKGQRYPTES